MIETLVMLIDSFTYMAQVMQNFLEIPLSFLDTLSQWAESLDFVGFISVPIDAISAVLVFFSGMLEVFIEFLTFWNNDLNAPIEILNQKPQEII